MKTILHIASDWQEGRSVAVTASRTGLSEATVEQVIAALGDGCRQVCLARGTKGLRDRNWRDWFARECILGRLRKPSWSLAVHQIGDGEHLSRAPGWLLVCARGGIDLSNPRVDDLLVFLRAAGFGVERFVVRATTEKQALEARLAFRAIYSALPDSEIVAPRRWRSMAYALLLTKEASAARLAPGKASELGALTALLIAALALGAIQAIQEKEQS